MKHSFPIVLGLSQANRKAHTKKKQPKSTTTENKLTFFLLEFCLHLKEMHLPFRNDENKENKKKKPMI